MSWAGLGNNYLVSRADLQDAVDNNIFTLKAGQTIPTTPSGKCVTALEAETYCNLDARGGLGIPDNRCPQKSWLVAAGYVSFPFYAYATNSPICDYSGFSSTVYQDDSLTGPFYTDPALTTVAPDGWVKRDDLKSVQYRLGASGGFGGTIYQIGATGLTVPLNMTNGGGISGGIRELLNFPESVSRTITATITAHTGSTSVPWYIEVRNLSGTVVATSATNNTADIGQTNSVTFSDNTCETLRVTVWTTLGTPSPVDSTNTFALTYENA